MDTSVLVEIKPLLKPRLNDHNIQTQHIATIFDDMLGVVGSNFKMVKFFTQYLWKLHDVVVALPGLCTNVALRRADQLYFRLATCHNTSQYGGQTHATCCVQKCCDMLRRNFAIVWPGLAKPGPTMLMISWVELLLSLGRSLTYKTTSGTRVAYFSYPHQ